MSIEISVSNKTQTNCNSIINKLLEAGIEARGIETTSVFEKTIEKGCLIRFGKEYNEHKKITHIWNTICKDYICSHLKIKGLFNGCIFDYLNPEVLEKLPDKTLCPHNKSTYSVSCNSE